MDLEQREQLQIMEVVTGKAMAEVVYKRYKGSGGGGTKGKRSVQG